jgi:SpoVK/Ycf46/Vps4 family AAA+-type ATPase
MSNSKDEKELSNFKWNNPKGLRFVSDEMLEIGNLLYEKANYSIKFIDVGSKKSSGDEESGSKKSIVKVKVSNNIIDLCRTNYSTQELLNALKSDNLEFEDGNKVFTKKKIDFTMIVYDPDGYKENYVIDDVCTGCQYERCPKFLLAYIAYLHENDLYDEKILDREEYRKNNTVNPYFGFNWNSIDNLKIVSDKIFDYSQALVDKGLVFVRPGLSRDELVKIYFAQTCSQIAKCNSDVSKIDDNNLGVDDFDEWIYIRRSINDPVYLCNTYNCRLEGCPAIIAGIIYYYKKIGRQDLIDEARKFYHDNQEEQDKKRSKIIDNVYEKIATKLQNSYKEIYSYSDRVKNINDLVDMISNENQENLHIAITGDLGVGKIEFAQKIGEALFNAGKIEEENPIVDRLANFTYHRVAAEDGQERRYYYSVEYRKNDEKCLYILTDIDEFINDYKVHMKEHSLGSYNETKRKQFKYTIELLTNMFYNNYFIIVGNEKDVKDFLELSTKIKYVFQNNIFHLPNMSMEEMEKEYSSLLKPDLFAEFRNNEEEYKKKFVEFVSLNESQLPYANQELCNYLAMYSNTKNAIVFPPDVYDRKTIDESLDGIIGLTQIKKKIKEFEKYMLYRTKAQSLGLSLDASNMHMIFTGNSGTGKTTIARIMAQMLYDMGIIKENKLLEVESKDLIGEYIGQTAPKTAEVIKRAMGGVLFIDEAYSLTKNKGINSDFGADAIATLIKAMEDHKDEFVVIFAGYTKEMHDFINMNPGIASRIGYTFDFPDYTQEELWEIYNLKMNKMGFILDDIHDDIIHICDYYLKRKNFGNGRFVDKLMQETIVKHSQNCGDNIKNITKEDIPTIEDMANYTKDDKNVDEMLANIVGMNNIKEKIKEFEAYIYFVKEAKERKIKIPAQNMHMIFTGNPGTGKTTIARIMAQMLYSMGVIHENKIIEVETKDLIGEYVGQTAPKTADVIERAMGGVLFIDEAYTLANLKGANSDFGADAIATLIKAMEDHKDGFVVIFAGYKKEMRDFVDCNPGIASRIGYTFHFEDYTSDELEEIYYRKLSSMGMNIQDEAKEKVKAIMKYFYSVENIGNGRFVDRVLQESIVRHSKNIMKIDKVSDERLLTIYAEDIPEIMEVAELLINNDEMVDVEKITPASLRKTAFHELGHAFVGYKLFDTPGIKLLTINAEGTGTLGHVSYDGSNYTLTNSREKFEKIITRLLAGMASEQVFIGYYESGNYSDLEQATGIAKRMVTSFGMSDFGLGQIKHPSSGLEYEVQREVNKILDRCFKNAINIVESNREIIENVANYVLEKKEISGEEIVQLFNNNGINN